MDDNWFQDPQASAAKLRDAIHHAVPERELLRQALRQLLTGGALGEKTVGQLEQAGLGVADLRVAVEQVVRRLPGVGTPEGLMARAIVDLLAGMPGVRSLLAGPELDMALGIAIVRNVTAALFPLTGERPDPKAPLRWAASELLAFRELSPDTLEKLTASERLELAQRLGEELPLMLAVVPVAGTAALARVVETACELLKRPGVVPAAEFNHAIAPVA